jgi:hypothetical protein
MRDRVAACRWSDWWGISGSAERRVIIHESLNFFLAEHFFGGRRRCRMIGPNLKIIVGKGLGVDKHVWLVNKLSTYLS